MNNLISQSLKLAEELQIKIQNNITNEEKQFHEKMKKLLENPVNKVLLIELLDRAFRTSDNNAKFEIINRTLNKYKLGSFFSPFERVLLFLFMNLGGVATNFSVPFFVKKIRDDSANMVLDSNPTYLGNHIAKREQENITINVNLIGEEVLGEGEAKSRLDQYVNALRSDYITYISIKITTIFSQIQILDFEYSKNNIVSRLDYLYAIASEEEKKQGKKKFINLDMEEFRDLELTVYSFMESISKFNIHAGIVLQAYLPDSYEYLKILLDFSKQRVLSGKPPIKIRIVKGANMESEETIASQRGWNLPTFSKKVNTDSNYNKMLHYVLENENYKYIQIGIASHNLFEIAYAYTIIENKNALSSFTFEMLEGMSMQASKEISQMQKLILYAPVCDIGHFNNAIAYLVRRLDENTAEQNFMRHFFGLELNNAAWNSQKQLFIESLEGIEKIDNSSRRIQDRNIIVENVSNGKEFTNEPDTDFILSQNRKWANDIKAKYENLSTQEIFAQSSRNLDSNEVLEIKDRINDRLVAKIHLASIEGIKQALEDAKKSDFGTLNLDSIHEILLKVAKNIRNKRGELIGISALEVGKSYLEVDAEVSEAVDFLEFYPYSLKKLKEENPKTKFTPKGIGVVITPWNFPVGISAGSIAAALSGGNKVIYKPSSISALTGYKLCECFWEAGVPKDALIYLPSKGGDISSYLLKDENIAFAILTGGEDTGYKILYSNPTLFLSGETGGKNATIVTKHADRDQAVKNIIHSAFSNSGQKCSATSLLILEEEVYNDKNFKETLKDAASSLNIGSTFDLKNKITCLATKPDSKLKKALNEKENTEEWLLPPRFKDDNEYLMAPCIKYGTKRGSYTYTTELFAPFLSVIKAKNLDDAIDIANATGYGLTGALESLDEKEWEIYKEKIEVGNLYINKPSTGAIVLRQPFGGMKKSAIGFGRKVGAFNYVVQFMNIEQNESDLNLTQSNLIVELQSMLNRNLIDNNEEIQKTISAINSYEFHYENEFSKTHEFVKIRGEDNLFRYKKIKNLLFRVSANDNFKDIVLVAAGAHIARVNLTISIDEKLFDEIFKDKKIIENIISKTQTNIVKENLSSCISRVFNFERIRYHETPNVNDELYKACAKEAKIIIREKPLMNGRFELLYYFNEQSMSISYHRYGNLGSRVLKS